MKEKTKHREAFDCYYLNYHELKNVDRAVEAVAKYCKCSIKTVYRWKAAFDWDAKMADRDKVVHTRVDELMETTAEEEMGTIKSIIYELLNTAIEDIKAGELRIKTAFELKEIIKLMMLLRGESTDNIKIEIDTLEQVKEELEEYGDMFELVAIEEAHNK